MKSGFLRRSWSGTDFGKTFFGKGFLPLLIAAFVVAGCGSGPSSPAAANSQAEAAAPQAAAQLPADVYPDSRNRLPLVKREDLDERGKKVFDENAGDSRNLAGLQGPGGIRLNNPRLSELNTPVSAYLRFENGLGPRLTQLAFLVAARGIDSQFEWTAHEPAALKVGVSQELIDIVKYNKPLTGVDEKDAAIIQLGREAFGPRKVSSETFKRALSLFGKETLINLVSFIGYQAQTGVLLVVLDQQLPPGQKPLLPIP